MGIGCGVAVEAEPINAEAALSFGKVACADLTVELELPSAVK